MSKSEKNSAQTNRQTNRQTDKQYENTGHAVNQKEENNERRQITWESYVVTSQYASADQTVFF